MVTLTTTERNIIITAARVGPENIDDLVRVHGLPPDATRQTLARGLEKLTQKRRETVRPAGSWLTLPELARRTGRSRKWLKYQLEVVLNIRPQPRKMHNNRIVDHYPPESELALQRIIKGLKPAGDWPTTPQVAARCDIAFGTAANRLNKLKLENSEINPEQRITHKTHQLTLHWPPRVIELISECPHQPRYCRCTAA